MAKTDSGQSAIDQFHDKYLDDEQGINIPKKTVYNAFVQFCHKNGSQPPTQHKMTRRLHAKHDIESGRVYFDDVQQRCFLNTTITPLSETLLDIVEGDITEK